MKVSKQVRPEASRPMEAVTAPPSFGSSERWSSLTLDATGRVKCTTGGCSTNGSGTVPRRWPVAESTSIRSGPAATVV
ncbi:MAG: hypothetical protein ABI317_05835 [Gaiellales bacterium]